MDQELIFNLVMPVDAKQGVISCSPLARFPFVHGTSLLVMMAQINQLFKA